MCDEDVGVRFFVFKQKTAYEMRISDWSSDVCSSDLRLPFRDLEGDMPDRSDGAVGHREIDGQIPDGQKNLFGHRRVPCIFRGSKASRAASPMNTDRKSVV